MLNIAEGTDPTNPAWYDADTGRAYFVPGFIGTSEDAVAAVLHEVGEYHGLESMLGPRGWRTLKGRIAQMARGKSDVRAAWDGVIDNYPEFTGLAGVDPALAIENDRFVHEVIAKIGESAAGRKTGLWRELLASINRFLLKMGLGRQINKNELADLVAGSLARLMRGRGPDGGPGGGRMNMNARRVWQGIRTVNDAIVPETPEYAGSATGNLAEIPAASGIVESLPIRLSVGVAKGSHAGFGLSHIADNAGKDTRRAPPAETGELAEDIVREVVRVLAGVRTAHQDGRRVALVAPSLNRAVIVEERERSGERYYSAVTVVSSSSRNWGNSEWAGRLAFPAREAAETSPPTAQSRQTDESPRSDRKWLGRVTVSAADRGRNREARLPFKMRTAKRTKKRTDG